MKKSELKKIIKEEIEKMKLNERQTAGYLVIGKGRQRQTLYPSGDNPKLYKSKSQAVKQAKKLDDSETDIGWTGKTTWIVRALEDATKVVKAGQPASDSIYDLMDKHGVDDGGKWTPLMPRNNDYSFSGRRF